MWPGEALRERLRSDVRPGGDAWVAASKCSRREKKLKQEKACNVPVVEKGILSEEENILSPSLELLSLQAKSFLQ